MTVSSETNKETCDGDGGTHLYSTAFTFAANSEVKVTLVTDATGAETVWTEGTQYTLTGAGTGIAGLVTVDFSPTDYRPATGETLVIELLPAFTQTTALPRGGTVSPKGVLEPMHDKRVRQLLRIKDQVDLSLKASVAETSIGALPNVDNRKNKIMGFDASGDPEMQDAIALTSSLTGESLNFIRVNSGETAYEFQTPAQVLTDIGAQGLDATLTALAAFSTNGLLTQTASDTFTGRTITGTANKVTVSDGDGVSGNPTITLPDAITLVTPTVSGNLIVTGNLTVNGTTVTNDATNTVIKDPLIELNTGAASNGNDLGLVMERGSTGDNAFMGWDESGDYFVVATTTATGTSTGNISYTTADFHCAGLNATGGGSLTGTWSDLGTVTTVDINGGTLDGASIGAASASTIKGTTIEATTSLKLATGATVTGILDEDAMGSNSATQLATQQSIKAYFDNSVPEPGIKFAFESTTTDVDQGAGKLWLNNAAPSSATVLYVDDVDADGGNVNSWADAIDDVVNTTSRGALIVAKYGSSSAMMVFNVTGTVTSATTYTKIPVSHSYSIGTISDTDDIGVLFIPSGNDGAGSGTVTSVATGTGLTGGPITSTGTININAGGVSATELASDAVTTIKILDSNITTAKVADNAVTLAKLAGGTANSYIVFDGSGDPAEQTPGGTYSMMLSASFFKPTTTAGASSSAEEESTTNKINFDYIAFDAATEEHIYANFVIPKAFDVSAGFKYKIHWKHPATATNFGAVWGVAMLALGNDDAIDTALGTEVTVTDTGGTTGDIYISPESTAVTPSNTLAKGDNVYLEIARVAANGSDTMTVDAHFLDIELIFDTDARDDT